MKTDSEKITQLVYDLANSESESALKSLYLIYYQRLFRFVNLYSPSAEDTEEILSDIFLALWDGRKKLMDIDNFNSFIYGIARHKAISFIRKRQLEYVDLDNYPVDLFFATETTAEDDLITKEEIEKINLAINNLPEKAKMTFKLIREDNLKYKEVSDILGISVKTVEAHMATAIRKLRDALK